MIKLILIFSIFIQVVFGTINQHKDVSLNTGQISVLWVSTMFNEKDAPLVTKPGNGIPEVSYDLTFTPQLSKEGGNLLINDMVSQVVLMEGGNLDEVGVSAEYFCCSKDNPHCKGRVNSVYISNDVKKSRFVNIEDVVIPLNSENPTPFNIKRKITNLSTTNKYILFVAHCDRHTINAYTDNDAVNSLGIPLSITGSSTWLNPYGYLPGHLFGYLPFYGILTLGYFIVVAAWLCNIVIRKQDIIRLHKFFSLLLLLCIIESSSCYYEYLHLNMMGTRSPFVGYACMGSKLVHQSYSRFLLVALTLGYGVCVPSLGASKIPLNALTIVYLFAVGGRELVIRDLAASNMESSTTLNFFNIICALTEAVFFAWMYSALHNTLDKLKSENQMMKHTLFKKFTTLLIACWFAMVAFITYSFIFQITPTTSREWSSWWFLDIGFWQLLYFVIIVTIAILWRPTEISKNFDYFQVQMNEHDGNMDMDDDLEDGDLEMGELGVGKSTSLMDDDDDDDDSEFDNM